MGVKPELNIRNTIAIALHMYQLLRDNHYQCHRHKPERDVDAPEAGGSISRFCEHIGFILLPNARFSSVVFCRHSILGTSSLEEQLDTRISGEADVHSCLTALALKIKPGVQFGTEACFPHMSMNSKSPGLHSAKVSFRVDYITLNLWTSSSIASKSIGWRSPRKHVRLSARVNF